MINDNNDNAIHDVYRTKSWTVLVVTVTAKIVTIKCLIVLSLFPFYFLLKLAQSEYHWVYNSSVKLIKRMPTRL